MGAKAPQPAPNRCLSHGRNGEPVLPKPNPSPPPPPKRPDVVRIEVSLIGAPKP